MNLTLKNLENCFKAAVNTKAKYVAVAVKVKNLPQPEIIINPVENAELKLNYYKSAYTEELKLKSADIYITGFTHGDSLAEIERDLFGKSK